MPFKVGNIYGRFTKPKAKKSYRWKGDKAGDRTKHIWIARVYGSPKECENHSCLGKSNYYDWASISSSCKRKRKDYLRLCRSCHKKFDMGLINVKAVKKPLKYKFNGEDLKNIREQYKRKNKTQVQLAMEYEVCQSHISKVINYKYYQN